MLFVLLFNRFKEPQWIQWNCEDSYCKLFCVRFLPCCLPCWGLYNWKPLRVKQFQSLWQPLLSPLLRMRVELRRRRDKIIRTQVWRGRSPAQSRGLCCKRPRVGWPRRPRPLKTRTEGSGTVCRTPQVHLKLACQPCQQRPPLVTPHTRAQLPSDCSLQTWWGNEKHKKKNHDWSFFKFYSALCLYFLSFCRRILCNIDCCLY